MLECKLIFLHCLLAVTLLQWSGEKFLLAEGAPESFDSSMLSEIDSSEEKSSSDLTAKLLLLDELVSLENDVIETKRKRSFPGFGSPVDRLSVSSMDLKNKPRKVVEPPKRRFGVPIDRIGTNRLANSRG
ncbi:osteocrin [Latimeria chalumnae]|uniref:Osteocrin n=1 Tax=Latimeria chalumnae TaxID=7897 RepID=H3BBC4_LATCH|nr:PREDICTED: osteocrin [Latimeria chalumnae]|eukprot:XP_005992527.1 PREDICTED: osteocrin [Latimeria chalumnae]